jgi:hypothetical protein
MFKQDMGGIMSAIYYEDRPLESVLFDRRRPAGCVDERAAYSLLLENTSFTALDWIDRAGIDGEICTTSPVDFENEGEQEFARALEVYQILWRYKPRTFAVEWDDEGNFVDSFTPAFYLPGQDRYVELTAPDSLVSSTARKVRLLRQQYSGVKIDLIFWPGLSQHNQRRSE